MKQLSLFALADPIAKMLGSWSVELTTYSILLRLVTVIILTSNLGSDIILNDLEQRRAQGSNELSDEAKHQIDLLLRSKFRPEFLNRLDEIVYYKSLTKDEMRKIVDLQLQDLRKRMEEGKHLKLEVTTAAKDFIIDSSYDLSLIHISEPTRPY